MKKILKGLLLLLIVYAATFTTRVLAETFEVKFAYYDNTIISTQYVNSGDKVIRPSDPVVPNNREFKCWRESSKYECFDFNTRIEENKTLYAGIGIYNNWDLNGGTPINWDPSEYTFTYSHANFPVIELIYGFSLYVQPPEGYEVYGIEHNGVSYYSGDYVNYNDSEELYITDKVLYRLKQYTVTFNSMGGTPVSSQVVDHGESVVAPTAPTKNNRAFTCWKTDLAQPDCYDFSSPVTEDLTLNAFFVVNLHLDLNGATIKDEYAIYGDVLINGVLYDSQVLSLSYSGAMDMLEPINPPAGMKLDAFEINGTRYEYGSSFTVDETVGYNNTLKFLWTANPRTVTFDTRGGSPSVASQSVTIGGKAVFPSESITKANRDFECWKTDITLEACYDWNTPVTNDMTLYADYMTYYHVDLNGGVVKQGQSYDLDYTMTEGIAISISDSYNEIINTIAAPTGYELDAFEVNGVRYEYGDTYSVDNTTLLNNDVKLLWKLKQYTVTFDTRGGTPISSQVVSHGEKVTQPSDPTKSERLFRYWAIYPQTTMFDFDTQITSDLTLTALYQVNIFVDINGGTFTDYMMSTINAAPEYLISENVVKTATVEFIFDSLTEQGRVFGIMANYIATTTANPPEYMQLDAYEWNGTRYEFDEDIDHDDVHYDNTLKILWKPVQHVVTFDSVGGTTIASQLVDHGSSASTPTSPTKTNRTFRCWSLEYDASGNRCYNFTSPVTEDITLHAVYTVRYNIDLNGGYFKEGIVTPLPGSNNNLQDLTGGWDENVSFQVTQQLYDVVSEVVIPPENHVIDAFESNGVRKGVGDTLGIEDDYPAEITIKYLWKPVQYTVTFDTRGGTNITSQLVDHGAKATQPADPTKPERSFGNWAVYPSTVPYDFDTPVTSDLTLTALYWLNVYVDKNGGTFTDNMIEQNNLYPDHVINEDIVLIEDQDWDFEEGWTTAGFGNIAKAVANMVANPPANMQLDAFEWNGTRYEFTDNNIGYDDILLYNNNLKILWKLNQYTVAFDSNGGTTISSQVVDHGSTVTQPANPELTNATFEGWYLDEEFAQPFDFSTEITEDITLHARYVVDLYYRIYDMTSQNQNVGGTVSINSIALSTSNVTSVTYGSDVALVATPASDYHFVEWKVTTGNDVALNNSTSVGTNNTYTISNISSNMTAWAVFEEDTITYTINFVQNGGSITPSQTIVAGETLTQPADPTKDDRVFICWKQSLNTNESCYDFDNPVNSSFDLYPVYGVNRSVDLNGGTIKSGQTYETSSIVQEDTTETFTQADKNQVIDSITPPTGYEFDAWEINGTRYDIGDSYSITNDYTVKLLWKKLKKTIIFDSVGGTATPTQTVDYGDPGVQPEDPTKENRVFDCWVKITSTGRENHCYDWSQPITEDIILYPKYYVYYNRDLNGGTIKEGKTLETTNLHNDESVSGDYTNIDIRYVYLQAYVDNTLDAVEPPTGYEFDAFEVNGVRKEIGSYFIVDENVGLYNTEKILWKKKQFTVYFLSANGSTTPSQTVEYGDKAIQPADPTKNNRIFRCWATDVYQCYDFDTPVTENMVLFPLYVVYIHKDLNGATIKEGETYSIDNQMEESFVEGNYSVRLGKLYHPIEVNTINTVLNPPEGYEFDAWELNGVRKEIGDSFHIEESYGLHNTEKLLWKLKNYEVIFEPGNGTTIPTQTIQHGSFVTEPTDPSKDGYGFICWKVQGENDCYDFTAPVTSGMTLEAYYKEYINVHIDLNGGTVKEGKTFDVDYQELIETSFAHTQADKNNIINKINAPTGYEFDAWEINGIRYDIDDWYYISGPFTKKLLWSPIDYIITFDSNGGTTVPAQTIPYGTKVTRPTDPTKDTYIFEGWYTDLELTNKYHFDSDIEGSFTLYAKWNRVKYNITFKEDNITSTTQEFEHGSKVIQPQDPTKDYNTFAGWYTDENYITEYDFDTEVVGPFTLYAKWEPVKYNIVFNVDDSSTIQEVAHGGKVIQPTDPLKDGYEFTGWYTTASLNELYDFDSTVLAPFELYAGFKKVYSLIGDGQEIVKGEAEDIIIKVSGYKTDLTSITINGEELDLNDYTIDGDNVDMTLLKDYLNTLDIGNYDITFTFADGGVSGSFRVVEGQVKGEEEQLDNPKTSDSIMTYIFLVLISLIGFGMGVLSIKKIK